MAIIRAAYLSIVVLIGNHPVPVVCGLCAPAAAGSSVCQRGPPPQACDARVCARARVCVRVHVGACVRACACAVRECECVCVVRAWSCVLCVRGCMCECRACVIVCVRRARALACVFRARTRAQRACGCMCGPGLGPRPAALEHEILEDREREPDRAPPDLKP